MLEFLNEQNISINIQIFASDISEASIENARNGFYPESISMDVSKERLSSFFTKVSGGYQVRKKLRDICIFAKQDLIKDPPFSNIDLVSCRNLLIYFSQTLQKKIIPVFHYSLKPEGFLLLGTSESIGKYADLFNLFDKKNKLYIKKHSYSRYNYDFNAIWNKSDNIKQHEKHTLHLVKEVDINK